MIGIAAMQTMAGCQKPTTTSTVPAVVSVPLAGYGLPKDFFSYSPAEGYCDSQIICYRFVAWLDASHIAVGFSTSSRKRGADGHPVKGNARILLFTADGQLKARRDIPYLADGNGELVADGEALAGPDGTLLFRLQSVNLDQGGRQESKSAVLLLDVQLRDVNKVEGMLEQTTLVKRTMIFQEGFVSTGPRTYDFVNSKSSTPFESHTIDWPTGTMDRKFGEDGAAYMACTQELEAGKYEQSPIISAGANRRCAMQYDGFDGTKWTAPIRQNEVGELIGEFRDGSIAAEIRGREGSERIAVWRRDGKEQSLPWLPKGFAGDVITPTSDMSRYGAMGVSTDFVCRHSITKCEQHWMVFDALRASPIVDRAFPRTGSVALSPDGMKYASLEDGKLQIFSLPK